MLLKRIVLFFSGCLLLSLPLNAQQYARGNYSMGFTVCANSTRLVRDSVKYDSSMLPGAGIEFYSNLTGRLDIHYGLQFSMKGTNSYDTLGNLRTYHIEPFASIQFSPIKSVSLEAGAQYSRLIMSQTVTISGSSSSGQKRNEIEGFNSTVEYFAGAQVNMNRQSRLGFRYYIPYAGTEFRRLEFRLLFIMIEGYSRKRSS